MKIGGVILSAWKGTFVGGVMETRVGKGVGLLLRRAMGAKIIGVDLVLWSVRPTAEFWPEEGHDFFLQLSHLYAPLYNENRQESFLL